jgi:hypothetical protein
MNCRCREFPPTSHEQLGFSVTSAPCGKAILDIVADLVRAFTASGMLQCVFGATIQYSAILALEVCEFIAKLPNVDYVMRQGR